MFKKNLGVKQHDMTDCGAACLASISNYYKLKLPIARIRQIAGTDKKGTSLFGMIKCAEEIGYVAKGVKGDFEGMKEVPLPAVAHIIQKKVLQHYIVVYEIKEDHVVVMDPAVGKIEKKNLQEFLEEWTGVLMLIAPGEQFEPGDHTTSLAIRFWNLIRPHKSILFQALFGAIIYTLLGLSTSIYIQKITDFVLIDGNTNLLNLLSITMIVLLILQIFIGYTKTIFVVKTGQKLDAQLILGYYKHLLRLPQRFFDTMRVGEIISRIGDAIKIRAFINDVAVDLFVNVFIVLFSFGLMYSYNAKLALIMTIIIPLYLLIFYVTNKLNQKQERKLMENAADLQAHLVESLNSVKTIKQFGLEHYANFKTETRFVNLLQTTYRSAVTAVASGNSSEFASRLFTILLLWIGSYYVIDRSITPGELLSFYALIGYFTGPAISLIGMNKTFQNAIIAADRLFEIIDLEREDEDLIDLKEEQIGHITFKDVGFAYGTRKEVFDGFNLTIKKNKVTAIVGESGSGKSTIAALIQKLYKLKGGQLLIGDVDLKYVSSDSLRKHISIVPQQLDLFSGNVIENIAVGEDSPDLQRIIKICNELEMIQLIESLPGGFESHLGENGTQLSGGQRQKLAIARALYKNPEILILDEATASLDSVSELHVQRAINKFKETGKTVIVIAHRLSTIMNADKIMVLEDGKLIEKGSHKKLISLKGKYFDLWTKQFPNHVRLQLNKAA